MTYPPQQPGPGGWGQQPPGGAGAPGPQQGQPPQQQPPPQHPQQQPAWYGNQHTGWGQGQPGQQPPPQPGPPQQPGQNVPPPPDWGGVEFGQSSWNLEANAFGELDPPKKKSKLPLIFGIVGAVAVAGGAAVGLFFLFNSGPGDPEPVAQEVVQKANAGEFDSMNGQLCQSREAQLQKEIDMLKAMDLNIKVDQVTENGDQATATLSGTFTQGGNATPVEQKMSLVAEDGEWKVCNFDQ